MIMEWFSLVSVIYVVSCILLSVMTFTFDNNYGGLAMQIVTNAYDRRSTVNQ